MKIRIQAVHFDATEQLKAFIEKKLNKLTRFSDEILEAEVFLKVVKPEVANNKDASVRLITKGKEFFAEKTTNTFEESIDVCCSALKHQIEKRKDAHRHSDELPQEVLDIDDNDFEDLLED